MDCEALIIPLPTDTQTVAICSIFPLSLDVCFQTEKQHEIIQRRATESDYLLELLPGEEGTAVLTERPTLAVNVKFVRHTYRIFERLSFLYVL